MNRIVLYWFPGNRVDHPPTPECLFWKETNNRWFDRRKAASCRSSFPLPVRQGISPIVLPGCFAWKGSRLLRIAGWARPGSKLRRSIFYLSSFRSPLSVKVEIWLSIALNPARGLSSICLSAPLPRPGSNSACPQPCEALTQIPQFSKVKEIYRGVRVAEGVRQLSASSQTSEVKRSLVNGQGLAQIPREVRINTSHHAHVI